MRDIYQDFKATKVTLQTVSDTQIRQGDKLDNIATIVYQEVGRVDVINDRVGKLELK